MEFPKVKKRLSDILPDSSDLAARSKQIAVGMIMFAIGAFAPPGESVLPKTQVSEIKVERNFESAAKLILAQQSDPRQMTTQHYSHYSHSSHYSHYSHQSHYSHYSSR